MWIKFLILWIPFTIAMWAFAPSIKWKIMFTIAGAVGIAIALMGKSIPSVSNAVLRKRRDW